MLGRKKSINAAKLDEAVTRLLDDMQTYGPESSEYSDFLEHLERVTAINDRKSKMNVDMTTVLQVAGSLLGILTIVAYEQKHVMTSKALSFVKAPH